MKKIIFFLLICPSIVFARLSISMDGGITGLTSNSVIDMGHDSLRIWAGTGGGVSVSLDEGANWITHDKSLGLPEEGTSALSANDRGVWVASSHSENFQGESIPTGDGISLSIDGAQSWTVFTPRQATWNGMLAYDIALWDSIAYAACFYGGLIRTLGWGESWQNLFPSQLDPINSDSIDYHTNSFTRLTNRFFSVEVDTTGFPDTLSVWAGSAAGIARFFFLKSSQGFNTYPDSIDKIYRADTSVVDSLKLPGDFVVALGIQNFGGTKTVWAACRPAYSGYLRVAYSQDEGRSWHVAHIAKGSSSDVEGWDFTFVADTVYVATNFGLFWSCGDYSQWDLLSGFVDLSRQTFYQNDAPFFCVHAVEGVIWAGGTDGIVKSQDGEWNVFRSAVDKDDHYAYPSPFSPIYSTRKGTTIHFTPVLNTTATVKIYDFNLEEVKTVVSNLPRLGGVESDDIVWDGTNDKGDVVANGVYFYRVELADDQDLWGKVVVIR